MSDVTDVTIERADSVTVTFDDGVVCTFPVGELRAACPCAACRNVRDRGDHITVPDSIAIRDAHLAGAWGISIDWSDGHATGIYAWQNLRRWWEFGLAGTVDAPG
jgi:DUF971 family protein